jgi:transitional endoplasmic reticulum ATPase
MLSRSARVSVFEIAGVEILAKEVGESEKRVHALFERARASSPSIILFDDIDAIAPIRGFQTGQAGDRLLTTLLVEMDGIAGTRDDGVVILATTNRISAMDPAITRPGRFDFIIEVGLPDREARREIFELYTKDMALENRDEAREVVVGMREGLSGAEIEGIVREAAMIELRKNVESLVVTVDSFREAIKGYEKKGIREAAKPKRVWADAKRKKKL